MPCINPCHLTGNSALETFPINDGRIGVVTLHEGVFIYDPETGKSSSRLSIDELDPIHSRYCFSPDGNYFIFSQETSKGHALRLIDIHTKSLIRSYALQENPVDIVRFGPASFNFIAGTSTGRVFLWNVESVNLVARLSSFPEYTPHSAPPPNNYISDITFSKNLVATTGSGGSIVITNLQTQANTKRLKPGKRRIDALCFLNEQFIASGNEDGLLEVCHIDEHYAVKRIPSTIGAIRQLLKIPHSDYLLAVSRYAHIGLINVQTMEIVDSHFIECPATIRSATLTGPMRLLTCLEDGSLKDIELAPVDAFNTLIEEEDYASAYAMLEHEPLLKITTHYQKLEQRFNTAYKKAAAALEEERNEDARCFLEPFTMIIQKRQPIQTLLNAFTHYQRFKSVIREKKYAIAYGLAYQYPPLQETKTFESLEKLWSETFDKAQKLMIKGDQAGGKKVFSDFLTVQVKNDQIRLLLHEPEIVLDYIQAVQNRDYATLKMITEDEPVLRQFTSYRQITAELKAMPSAILTAIKTNQFAKAQEQLDLIADIPSLSHEYDHMLSLLKRAEKLHTLWSESEEKRCFELLDTDPELAQLPQSKKMEKTWEVKMTACEEAARLGNPSKIKSILGELIRLRSRIERIGNLLRLSYQTQLKYYITQENFNAVKQGIEQYLTLFGIDNETRHLIQLMEEKEVPLELEEKHTQHRPRTIWLSLTQGNVPDDITRFE